MRRRVQQLGASLFRRREFGLAFLVLLTTLGVSAVDVRFLSLENWRDILVRASPTAIVCCGVMLVVVLGEIDISVGSLMALLAAAMGLMLSEFHAAWPVWLGVLLTLLLGAAVGLSTGWLVTWGRVPSIIVTLGMLTGLRGVTTLLMRGENIDGLPELLGDLAKRGVGGVPISIWSAGVRRPGDCGSDQPHAARASLIRGGKRSRRGAPDGPFRASTETFRVRLHRSLDRLGNRRGCAAATQNRGGHWSGV